MTRLRVPHILKAVSFIRAGAIGRVHKVPLCWTRNSARFKNDIPAIAENSVDWRAFVGGAPWQAYDPYKMVPWLPLINISEPTRPY